MERSDRHGMVIERTRSTGVVIHRICPLQDPRWRIFVERHPGASLFHTPEWLEVLRRTYGYQPVCLTTAAPEEALRNGIVLCQIESWLTGRRLVSLPFSDHCQPLSSCQEELECLLSFLESEYELANWRYIEVRAVKLPEGIRTRFGSAQRFCLHRLDLSRPLDVIFRSFHKDCVQRKIRRAEREALRCESGNSQALLEKFYGLLVCTRRRHGLPPQPFAWFRNLAACMGDRLTVRIAMKEHRPVAGILTLSYKHTLVFKYGASDRRFSSLGGTQLVLWQAIKDAQHTGVSELDMGRSEADDHGLVDFKARWGTRRSELQYLRCPEPARSAAAIATGLRAGRQIFAYAPSSLAIAVGRNLYRHLG
jgi:hypothetical protein